MAVLWKRKEGLAAYTTRQGRKRRWIIVSFLSAPTLFLIVFLGAPVLWALWFSLTNLALTGPHALHVNFVGLENFSRALTSSQFWNSIKESLFYLVGSGIIGQVGLGLFLAMFLRRVPTIFKNILLALIVLSWVIPEIVTAFIWSAYLQNPSGLFNQTIHIFGVPPHPWLFQYPMTFLILANIWRGTAFATLILSAAIEAVPKELIEAAYLDGCNRWTLFSKVLVPLIRNSLVTTLVLITLWTLSDFTLIYVLTSGGPGFSTDVLTVFTYQKSFSFYELGYGSALSVILLLISSGLSLIYINLVGHEY